MLQELVDFKSFCGGFYTQHITRNMEEFKKKIIAYRQKFGPLLGPGQYA